MDIQEISLIDRQWCDANGVEEIADHIAGLSPRETDAAIRALNYAYRGTAARNFGLDPVNMVPINPVGALLDDAYDAVCGARAPLTAAEIAPVVVWLRGEAMPA